MQGFSVSIKVNRATIWNSTSKINKK